MHLLIALAMTLNTACAASPYKKRTDDCMACVAEQLECISAALADDHNDANKYKEEIRKCEAIFQACAVPKDCRK